MIIGTNTPSGSLGQYALKFKKHLYLSDTFVVNGEGVSKECACILDLLVAAQGLGLCCWHQLHMQASVSWLRDDQAYNMGPKIFMKLLTKRSDPNVKETLDTPSPYVWSKVTVSASVVLPGRPVN